MQAENPHRSTESSRRVRNEMTKPSTEERGYDRRGRCERDARTSARQSPAPKATCRRGSLISRRRVDGYTHEKADGIAIGSATVAALDRARRRSFRSNAADDLAV